MANKFWSERMFWKSTWPIDPNSSLLGIFCGSTDVSSYRAAHLLVGPAFQRPACLGIHSSPALRPTPLDPPNLGYPVKTRRHTAPKILWTECVRMGVSTNQSDLMRTDLLSLGADDTDWPSTTLENSDRQGSKVAASIWSVTSSASAPNDKASTTEVHLRKTSSICLIRLRIYDWN